MRRSPHFYYRTSLSTRYYIFQPSALPQLVKLDGGEQRLLQGKVHVIKGIHQNPLAVLIGPYFRRVVPVVVFVSQMDHPRIQSHADAGTDVGCGIGITDKPEGWIVPDRLQDVLRIPAALDCRILVGNLLMHPLSQG